MSEEEREVVEYFTRFVPFMWWKQPDENGRLKIDIDLSRKIDTILNLIQSQQKEIEKLKDKNKELLRKLRNRVKEVKKLTKYSLYKKEFSRLNKEIEKKDKIINEMTEAIDDESLGDKICKEIESKILCKNVLVENCKECIKQYFEKKVEESNAK